MNWNMNVTSHVTVVYYVKKLTQAKMGSFLYINFSVSIKGINTIKDVISIQTEISVNK